MLLASIWLIYDVIKQINYSNYKIWKLPWELGILLGVGIGVNVIIKPGSPQVR